MNNIINIIVVIFFIEFGKDLIENILLKSKVKFLKLNFVIDSTFTKINPNIIISFLYLSIPFNILKNKSIKYSLIP